MGLKVFLNDQQRDLGDLTAEELRVVVTQLMTAMERMNRHATRIEVHVERFQDGALMRDVGPELAAIERIYDAALPERR